VLITFLRPQRERVISPATMEYDSVIILKGMVTVREYRIRERRGLATKYNDVYYWGIILCLLGYSASFED